VWLECREPAWQAQALTPNPSPTRSSTQARTFIIAPRNKDGQIPTQTQIAHGDLRRKGPGEPVMTEDTGAVTL
jgi:hypothetical protein